MIKIIAIIAQLCSIESSGSTALVINKHQLNCHSYYAKCMKTKPKEIWNKDRLLTCMKDRK